MKNSNFLNGYMCKEADEDLSSNSNSNSNAECRHFAMVVSYSSLTYAVYVCWRGRGR